MSKKLKAFKDNKRDSSQDSTPTYVDRFFAKVGPWIILLAAGLLVFLILQIDKTNAKVSETEAYTRATNCIVARGAQPGFTQAEVEQCYVEVEKKTGLSLQRFDEQFKQTERGE